MSISGIGLDARMVRHTGIGTYVRGLLGGFDRKTLPAVPVLFGPQELLSGYPAFSRNSFTAPIYSLREQWNYPRLLKTCGLWHAPHYNVPFFKGQTRLVVTIHDLIHWIYRGKFFSPAQALYARTMLGRAVKTADHILTVSENTRRDLIRHFNADAAKITITPEAADARFKPCEDSIRIEAFKQSLGLPDNYFLVVGSLKPHKNVLWLVRLYRELYKDGKVKAELVLAGRKDKKYPAGYEELAALESGQGIRLVSELHEDDLLTLYHGALALLHPSLYEGFGLTLLEAMASGTPVAAFRTASIPEVTGDAALLAEPGDAAGFAQMISHLEREAALREDLKQRGLVRASRFSWQKMAAQTAAVYRKLL